MSDGTDGSDRNGGVMRSAPRERQGNMRKIVRYAGTPHVVHHCEREKLLREPCAHHDSHPEVATHIIFFDDDIGVPMRAGTLSSGIALCDQCFLAIEAALLGDGYLIVDGASPFEKSMGRERIRNAGALWAIANAHEEDMSAAELESHFAEYPFLRNAELVDRFLREVERAEPGTIHRPMALERRMGWVREDQ